MMSNLGQEPSSWPPRLPVCVGAVVLNGERALFVRQAQGHALAGQWSIPWGLVEPGESPDQAALRETLEESGITACIEGLLGLQCLPENGWIALVFLCQHVSGQPTGDGSAETDAAAYLSLAEIEVFDEPIEPWCRWIVQRVLRGEHRLIPPVPDNPYRPRAAFL